MNCFYFSCDLSLCDGSSCDSYSQRRNVSKLVAILLYKLKCNFCHVFEFVWLVYTKQAGQLYIVVCGRIEQVGFGREFCFSSGRARFPWLPDRLHDKIVKKKGLVLGSAYPFACTANAKHGKKSSPFSKFPRLFANVQRKLDYSQTCIKRTSLGNCEVSA